MNYLATLSNMCHVPAGSIYRGSGKFDFRSDRLPDIAKEKLKEVKDDGTPVWTKAGEKVKTSAELTKAGQPVSKDKKSKVKPEPIGVVGGGKKP